jgi:hypothetical protein
MSGPSAVQNGRMTKKIYCDAERELYRTVIVKPEGNPRYWTMPAEPTRREKIPCESRGGTVHRCIGPHGHDGMHLCSCHWMWSPLPPDGDSDV